MRTRKLLARTPEKKVRVSPSPYHLLRHSPLGAIRDFGLLHPTRFRPTLESFSSLALKNLG